MLPFGPRSFQGYRLVAEYFACPQRFMFFELSGLAPSLAKSEGSELDVILLLDRAEPQLETYVGPPNFALFAAPAINLFPKTADRIHLSDQAHEHHVIPDRTRPLDFEVYEVTSLTGFGTELEQQQSFLPFYATSDLATGSEHGAYFTLHRAPRVLSTNQRKYGPRSSYIGSEVFLSLVDGKEAPYHHDLRQLAVSTLCTNRDLALLMPVGKGKTDFLLETGAPVETVRCLAGPTRPRASPLFNDGDFLWRLVSHLTLNYLSLVDNDERQGAAALRDLLKLYSHTDDAPIRKQIEGVRTVASKPITRRVPTSGPITFGRGLEITRHVRRIGVRGDRRVPAGGGAGAVFRPLRVDQFLHRDGPGDRRSRTGHAMASENRPAADRVAELLDAIRLHPDRFDFHQALRRLEAARSRSPRLGTSLRPTEDPIRLTQEPTLIFAPSTIASCEPAAPGRPARMAVYFGGLFGPNGPVPLHITEYARDRIRNAQDHTFARFLDMFHHRMLSLFYRAWAAGQPTVHYDRPDSDRFVAYVGAMAGIGMPSLQDRDDMPDLAKLHFAGRLVCHTRHAEGLQALLKEFFRLPMQLDQFVGHWLRLPDDCRCVLGSSTLSPRGRGVGGEGAVAPIPVRSAGSGLGLAQLGMSATIGDRVWDCQQKFRIIAGPISLADYERLLPGGASLHACWPSSITTSAWS